MKYLMKLCYVGTGFCGSQIQPNVRTVQGVLNVAFETLFGVRCKVTSCSRTDSGVHANAAALTVELPDGTVPIPPERLSLAVAPYLPEDVSVFDVVVKDAAFHVRHDVLEKEYVYLISNAMVRNPFLVHRAWFFPTELNDAAIAKMRCAAEQLIGRHDFSSFMAQGSPVADTVRNVKRITVERQEKIIRFSITADGFLYNMVRILVGTLVEVGLGRITVEEIPEILASHDRSRAGMTAPPDGLYLNCVRYADHKEEPLRR